MSPLPPAATELFRQALAELWHSPEHIDGLAGQLEQLALAHPQVSALAARAGLVRAWAQALAGQVDAAWQLCERSRSALADCGDASGEADARDLLARLAISRGEFDEAATLLRTNLAMPEAMREAAAWCNTIHRHGVLLERQGDFDAALRCYYRALSVARAAGRQGDEALALAGAGGLQLSLMNTPDSLALLDEAWALMHPARAHWRHLWFVVALNRLMALHLAQRRPEALAMAELVLARWPTAVLPGNRHKCLLLLGSVFVQAGQLARGQALLDEGFAARPAQFAPPVEWVWAQAQAWLAEGTRTGAADALRICNDHMAAAAQARLGYPDTPIDLLYLHTAAANAHTALGDPAAALAHERLALAAERDALGAAARAHRLTLQVRHELEAAEVARNQARQRERQAVAERERLAELNAALKAADAAKSRFLAAASHDLRQPVHALALQLALLRPTLREAHHQAMAERMQGSLQALKSMFDALLDLSRIDAGVVKPHRRAVALRPLCARLADEFAAAAEQRGLRLALRLAGPAVARTDPALLETMLRNLLDNALKYTARGGVVLALRASSRAWGAEGNTGPASAWRIQLRDTGPGIAPDDQARVWDEFVQLHPAPAAPGQADGEPVPRGLGLGLALVKRLAKLLELEITLRSRPGRGCLFELRLPAALAAGETDAERCGSAVAAPESGAPALTIALLEDDVAVRRDLAALLRQWGHRVVAGDDAATVLGLAKAAHRASLANRAPGAASPGGFDLILADLHLAGGADGLDEAARLRAAHPGSALRVITADTTPATVSRLAARGVAWFTKPLDTDELARCLAGVQRRQMREAK